MATRSLRVRDPNGASYNLNELAKKATGAATPAWLVGGLGAPARGRVLTTACGTCPDPRAALPAVANLRVG